MYDICCIGHITSDKIITPSSVNYLPGGTAFYFSHAMRHIPLRYGLVTAVGMAEQRYVNALANAGLAVHALPSEHTVCFENRYYENQDHRTQRVTCKADPFLPASLAPVRSAVYHLGPLLSDDISASLVYELAGHAKLSLDVQGFLREVVNEEVRPIDWVDKRELLPMIDYLKVNEAELCVLAGTAEIEAGAFMLMEWGVRELVITLGSNGSLIGSSGRLYRIPAYRPTAVIDATGCGDTYMAGYLSMRVQGKNIQDAGEYAAAMATLKIQASGPFSGTERDIEAVLRAGKVNGVF